MSRLSRGCLRCRKRKVKCDEGRPSCRRCIQRDELCEGYPDELSLLFRNENDKAARLSVRRAASTADLSSAGTSSRTSRTSISSWGSLSTRDPSDLSATDLAGLSLPPPYPWIKAVPQASAPSAETQAVSQFFEKYVMYPCNHGSSPGFLEQLPGLFNDPGKAKGRIALRWAVRATAYASLSSDQSSAALGNKALKCYGLALSALRESLADSREIPDDHVLMTVVVLDLFESIYLQDSDSLGSHAEGMAHILRLRGPEQLYGARSWSLFRLSHHRVQKQSLRNGELPETEAWLESLADELPYVRIEKDNYQISKICKRAQTLLKSIDDTDLSVGQTLEIVQEMHALDQFATTWRSSPGWAYKTIHRSQLIDDPDEALKFPEWLQLHSDVWIAYEWNYHRNGRIILHEHLLLCLDRLQTLQSSRQTIFENDICSFRNASITIIQSLVDEVLSTVPQSLGDIDHEGNILKCLPAATKCKGVGGYFLLWPIKIIKSTRSATPQQRTIAQGVFERIRECTGMKSALGERSCI